MEKEIKKKNDKTWGNFKNLLRNLNYFGRLAFKCVPWAIISMIIISILQGAFPVLISKVFGNLIDSIVKFVQSGNSSQVWYILIIYISIRLIPDLISTVYDLVDKYWYIKFGNFMEIFSLKKRGEVDIADVENPEFQDLSIRAFNNGVSPITHIIEISLENTRRLFLFMISAGAILLIDWRIFIITILTAIPSFII